MTEADLRRFLLDLALPLWERGYEVRWQGGTGLHTGEPLTHVMIRHGKRMLIVAVHDRAPVAESAPGLIASVGRAAERELGVPVAGEVLDYEEEHRA